MSAKLPYIVQPGSVTKILAKIKDAKTPERFTQDFLQTKLGFKGGNHRQFIPLAKKLGLLNSDGTPTDLYKKYRNPATAQAAIAQAIKTGYPELFERNEFAGNLSKEELRGLIVEISGLDANDRVVQLIAQTMENLKNQANFELPLVEEKVEEKAEQNHETNSSSQGEQGKDHFSSKLKLGLSYTINLVLPRTDDPAVFNAIFRSLRENILRD